MPIVVRCRRCEARFQAPDKSAGKSGKCPNCGGDLQFAGKGLIVCPFCGSEVFLTKRAAAETVAEISEPTG